MKWDKVKNFILGGGAAVLVVILFGYLEWRIAVNVADALTAQDIGTDAKIIAMDKATASNTAGVAWNKESISEEKRRLERVAAILMGETP